MAERDRLFKEDRRDEGRAMAERASEFAIRKNTFDPEALKARIAKTRAIGQANEAYYRKVIDAAADPLQTRAEAIENADKALQKILESGATNDESLRARQFEVEDILRTWAQASAEFDLADANLRIQALNASIEDRKADAAEGDAGLAELNKQLAAAKGAKTKAEKAVADAKESLEGLKKAKEESDADVAGKLLAPWSVQGSSGLVDRRGKLRKAYVIRYETAMRYGLTALHVAEELNGSYRYSFYRFSSHFLTTTMLYLLLVVAALTIMAASQAVVTDKLKGLRLAYLPTISVDDLVMRFTEIMLTVPVIFLILAILAIFEKDVYITMGVIGLTSWMGTTRFVRAEILSLREQDFVQSAQALGLSDFRIIWRHLVPNAISPVLVSATLGVAGAVLAESTLSFLGIGAKADQTTWGLILSEGREYIFDAPWLTWIPGIAILITVLSFNLLGEGLREAFNPKLRGR